MNRIFTVLLTGFVLAGWALPAHAQNDDSRDLVIKAQKAHGGREAIAKYKAVQVKYKGDIDANGIKGKVEGEVFYNYPERMKNVITVEVNDMKIQVEQGYDGKVLWLNVMGMNQELKDKELIAEMKESLYSEQVASLVDIDDKGYMLSPLGEAKVKNIDVIGVRISKKDKRDVNLWFDKKSHLIVKTEFRGKDPFGQGGETNQEKYYSDYKAVMGIMNPHRLEVHNDGKMLIEAELSELRYHEKLDDTYFQRP